jgi:hypothetical protein
VRFLGEGRKPTLVLPSGPAFNPASVPVLLLLPSAPATVFRMIVSKGLKQAYDMQDFAYSVVMALREQLTQDGKVKAPDKDMASSIATLGRTWKDAQEQIRIHKGKPLPGSLTHEKVKQGRQARSLGASMLASMHADHMPSGQASEQPDAGQGQAGTQSTPQA